MKILIVVDMQNDFISGALGSAAAQAIVPSVIQKIKGFDGKVFYTMDTHGENYLQTLEGKNLPVEHCIRNTDGWQIQQDVFEAAGENLAGVVHKPNFGFLGWKFEAESDIESIELCGVCTDICVISNALILKTIYPEIPVLVDAACCAGITPESHNAALLAMKMCQVIVK